MTSTTHTHTLPSDTDTDTEFLSVPEAAQRLGVSAHSLRLAIAAGRYPATTFPPLRGDRPLLRVRWADLVALGTPATPQP